MKPAVLLAVVMLAIGLAAPAWADSDEQAALDAVAPACKESPSKLDAEAGKALELLEDGGVYDETVTSVLQHLRKILPENAPEVDCAVWLGTYVQLRAPNRS